MCIAINGSKTMMQEKYKRDSERRGGSSLITTALVFIGGMMLGGAIMLAIASQRTSQASVGVPEEVALTATYIISEATRQAAPFINVPTATP
jgi:hypothetical protein